ncbi:MipA/OmpV family protein [Parendozoicomonas haliclonae]|uniref:Outer membrane protein OmpV n=1 Tax=Parendozoicomonas haliclonae TaxID=1960125 RepID=A0A1X7AR76_9GAMM|nr:MipA/OmpV family protein [Parendozoicomonas haliclonae]SMA50735.1 Outer membrane protein OmpV precursor [Parendozoicomonas haliclonae]
MKKTSLIPLAVAVTLSTAVSAEENDSSLSLGLGVGHEKSIYKGVDSETNGIPLVMYENGNFYLRGPEVGYTFFESSPVKIDAVVRYRMDGYDDKDSDDLRGMEDRDGTVEGGLTASVETGLGEWSIEAFGDAASTHDGYELELGWEKPYDLNKNWSIIPAASISYLSADLADYYYGVTAKEATVRRAAYTVDSDYVWELGLSALYKIDRNQIVRFAISYENYGSEIADSPIVDSDNSSRIGLVYAYRF